MLKTTVLPEVKILLNNKNPETQKIIISMFKAMGLPVHEDTKSYDFMYPYLLWDGVELCQSRHNIHISDQEIFVKTMEEFMSYFVTIGDVHIVKISDKYNAEITKESLKVGCQTLSFELVKELYNTMERLQ